MKVKPSRFLNEKSGFMGLTVWDLAVLGYLLISIHEPLSKLGLDWLAFLITGFAAYVLIALRLKYRRRTLRDFSKYLLRSRGLL